VRFRIERHASSGTGIRVLPEIPHLTPCLLEGPNGIGKTLAVHLLEIATGAQPFLAEPQLWSSLKSQLGPTTITIDHLAQGQTIELELLPEQWPDQVGEPLGDRLGLARVGGEEVPASTIGDLLSVVRIAGTETPAETVKRSMASTRQRLRAAAASLQPRVDAVREGLGELRHMLRDLDPEQLVRLDDEQERARKDSAHAAKRADETSRRLARLNEALEARAALSARSEDQRELEARLAQVESDLETARKERDELAKESDRARESLVQSGVIAQQLATAENTLQARLRRLSNRAEEASAALAAIGDPEDLDGELRRVTSELAAAEIERADLDSGERAEQVVGQLLASLDLARRSGLSEDQVLLYFDGQPITAERVADGLRARASELAERPTPGALESLLARIDEVERQRRALLEASERVQARDRQKELVEEQEAEVARLRGEIGADVQERLQKPLASLAAADNRVLSLARESVDLRAQLADRNLASESDAKAAWDAALDDLQIDPDEIETHVIEARSEDELAQRDLAIARRQLADLDHEVRVAAMAASRAAEELASRPDLLAKLGLSENGSVGPDTAERLASSVHTVDRRLDDVANTLAALAEAADRVAVGDHQRGRLFAEAFVAAAGEQLRADLDTPAIRTVMFDDQPLLELDLDERVLRWMDAGGEHQERPLAAFSTGEQAFAFTQARIRELEPPAAPDRLLVLDEFGAYVSADRMRHLAEFLYEGDVQAVASHVLVILPLQTNYAAELSETRGDLRKRYEDRVEQLDARGYITVPLREAVS
jgi:hypothetical protein